MRKRRAEEREKRRYGEHLSKRPSHIAVSLPTATQLYLLHEEIAKVSKLACWCLAAEIDVLTVYEASGKLKSVARNIEESVLLAVEEFYRPSCEERMNVVTHCLPGVLIRHTTVTDNDVPCAKEEGSVEKKDPGLRLIVNLISRDDGKPQLANVTRTVCNLVKENKLSPDLINVDYINKFMRDPFHPDPELLILSGDRICLEGFPPWQLRLTEIFHIGGNQDVCYNTFLHALHRYANCEMRFGR